MHAVSGNDVLVNLSIMHLFSNSSGTAAPEGSISTEYTQTR